MKPFTLIFAIVAWLMLSAFRQEIVPAEQAQPNDERSAQEALPQAEHEGWQTIAATSYQFDDDKGTYQANFPPNIQAMVGQLFTINGFILPLEPTETFSHFLLSKRTPTCYFCPPGAPVEMIEVNTTKPVAWSEDIVTIKGRLKLVNDSENGILFKLEGAEVID